MCTFRGEAFLAQQLASILRQSVSVDEVIVSDDASTDGTVELAARTLEASEVPFRVFTRSTALRVAANFAFGADQARTPLVAFADQDDVWHRDKVARLAPLLADDEGALLAHSDARIVDRAGDEIEPSLFASLEIGDGEWAAYVGDGAGPGPGPDQFGVLLRRNLVTGATTMVRRDFVVAAGVAPDPWIHDEWLAIAAALRSGIRTLRAPLIDYRQHGDNQIGQVTPTLRDKVDRVVGPGYEQQRLRVQRADALRARLGSLGATPEQRVEVERKLSHERRRLRMPDARLARVGAVAQGLRRGDYRRYSSRGTLDVIRDALHSRSDRPD
ncbi:glycosyl transferase [Pseudoclavibacter endophyticus]|nr:glycosyl transferase [Pseudoclavibacter endophyticus]